MTPHPIDPFLEAWEQLEHHADLEQRIRVYRALAVSHAWSRARLRATLRALLAQGPAQTRRFDTCFDTFFSTHDEALPDANTIEAVCAALRADLDAPPSTPPPDEGTTAATLDGPRPPGATPPTRARPTPGDEHLLLAGLGVLATVLLALGVMTAITVPTPAHHDAAVHTDAVVVDAPLPTLTPLPRPVASQVVRTPPKEYRRAVQEPWSKVLLRALGLCVAALAAVTLGEQRIRSQYERRVPMPPLPRARDDDFDDRVLDLSWSEAMPAPWPHTVYEDLADRTGFSPRGETQLDLPATVQATARAGGLLMPVERPARRPNTVRIVRIRTMDPIAAALVGALERGLRAAGVHVEGGDGGPERGRGDLNLVLVDATVLYDAARDAWGRIGHTAFVELRDPERWGHEVTLLPRGVFALTPEGLADAFDAARLDRIPPPSKTVASGDAFDRLRMAWPLAQAVALTAPLDLAALDALRRAVTPSLDFIALQRVLALDGVLGGPPAYRVTATLRERLCASLTPEDALWRDVLSWQRARLARVRAPGGSRAEALLVLERELCTMLLEGLEAVSLERLAGMARHAVLGPVVRRRIAEVLRLRSFSAPTDFGRAVLAGELKLCDGPQRPVVTPAETSRRDLATAALTLALGGGVGGAVWAKAQATFHWTGPWSANVGLDNQVYTFASCPDARDPGVLALTGFDAQAHPLCARLDTTQGVALHEATTRALLPFAFLDRRADGSQGVRCPAGTVGIGVEGEMTGPTSPRIVELRMVCGRPAKGLGYRRSSTITLVHVSREDATAAPFALGCGAGGHLVEMRAVGRAVETVPQRPPSPGDDTGMGGLRVRCGYADW